MATLIRKMHQSEYVQLLLLESVNVGLLAEGNAPNGVPNTHNVEGEMPLVINAPEITTCILIGDVKPLKTAWEYYNEATGIIDRERERDWLEQMDTILIFVRLIGGTDLY